MERQEIEQDLLDARRRRGLAKIEGRKFDSNEIAALETQLDELADADSAAAQRDREIAEADRLKNRAIFLAELDAERASYLEDLTQAEESLRDYAGATKRALAASERMARLTHRITGAPVPTPLMPSDVSNRIGGFAAAVLRDVIGMRLGPLEFPATPYSKPKENFRDRERALLERHLNTIGEDK